MNGMGIVVALATFMGVWGGHAAVRKIEFISPTVWLPASIFTLLGIGLEYSSLRSSSPQLSAVFGILGITVLWDALELTRQQRRVKKGLAPANPKNPRHARILAIYPSATTVNLLKRDPVGRPILPDEAIQLISKNP